MRSYQNRKKIVAVKQLTSLTLNYAIISKVKFFDHIDSNEE